MICDAIENCLQYINNFNPEKSIIAFAYITQNLLLCILETYTERKETSIHQARKSNREKVGIEGTGFTTIDGQHDPTLIK